MYISTVFIFLKEYVANRRIKLWANDARSMDVTLKQTKVSNPSQEFTFVVSDLFYEPSMNKYSKL